VPQGVEVRLLSRLLLNFVKKDNKMNRRGFTLTELIVCVWIAFCGTLSLVTIIGMLYLGYLLVMALTKYISS
jgi:hypothetical protein